ncbi:hypothetical protein MNEG_11166 [Monoraphidium neglectum]|uniref:Wings apart-like protein C-terminal domain-containing protein n=1 Tax=Monoraphidium neglectum TaxID=145388 RepID=A0A0D2M6D9_9CHLO|nr:hypothetical protein MNEG_11166 [Monoraphidium neglectum]KIY96796.1 hypothetical protein MNEG_11166 [Monoraphidium neglectum]|eukprot:XP_013895816.1 hypothetical protein MNEG_11166 [Monoraphidium neglectum]
MLQIKLAPDPGDPAHVHGQTVMEAQQCGELVQLQDDASYALDGLTPGSSISTQRDSAATLCEMLATRRGRLALRKDGLAQQVLSALAKVKAGRDAALALAAACALLALAAEDAHPAYMASTAAVVLAEQLLQESHDIQQTAADSAAGARLQRLLQNGSLLRHPSSGLSLSQLAAGSASQQQQLQQQAALAMERHEALTATQQGVLLTALAQATGAHDATRLQYTEVMRAKMLRHGLLVRLADLLRRLCCGEGGGTRGEQQASQGDQGAPGLAVDAAVVVGNAWLVATVLAVMENATFTAPENAACLASASFSKVLMNLTHGNTAGGVSAITQAGGAGAIVQLLQRLLPSWERGLAEAMRTEVLEHVEVVSVALGVLINLASTEPGVCCDLTGAGAAEGGAASPGVLPLLCSMLNATAERVAAEDAPQSPQPGSPSPPSSSQPSQRRHAAGSGQQRTGSQHEGPPGSPPPLVQPRTAGGNGGGKGGAPQRPGPMSTCLMPAGAGMPLTSQPERSSPQELASGGSSSSDNAGEAAIVEAYSAMLLGFLLRGSPGLQHAAAARLAGGSLEPVAAAIQRCLAFYVTAGAITEGTRGKLVQLLEELGRACSGAEAAGGCGEGGDGKDSG